MAKIDKIKEQIGWFKIIFGMLFATDISLIAYLFNRIEILTTVKIFLVLTGLIFTTIAIFIVNKNAMKKIESLEEL